MRQPWLPIITLLIVGVCMACAGFAYVAIRGPQLEHAVVGREFQLAPLAVYGGVAWLTDNEVALLPDWKVSTTPSNQVSAYLFDLSTAQEDVWFVRQNPRCRIVDILSPKVVAFGQMMYVEECRGDHFEMSLFRIQRPEDDSTLVYSQTVRSGLAPVDFSLQPGVNGRLVIGTLDYRLFDVSSATPQEVERGANELLTRPAWNPSGTELAYLGGLSGGIPRSGILRVVDSQFAKERVVLRDLGNISVLAWSVKGDWLAFSGQYQAQPGVWAINEAADRIVQIWSSQAPFSWSPTDNDRLLILDRGQNGRWALVETLLPTAPR